MVLTVGFLEGFTPPYTFLNKSMRLACGRVKKPDSELSPCFPFEHCPRYKTAPTLSTGQPG